MSRGFEQVSFISEGIIPKRATSKSAGYDFSCIEDFSLQVGELKVIKTGIKAYMNDDEVLKIFIRSSLGFKKQIMLANTTGIIDADYYNNEANEGHIMIALYNYGTEVQNFKKGDCVAQGIFEKYLLVDNDEVDAIRGGGIGSTSS